MTATGKILKRELRQLGGKGAQVQILSSRQFQSVKYAGQRPVRGFSNRSLPV
jgi:hypothetical protein